MKFHPEDSHGLVWVDLDPTEVYAFAANWPDFGPKCRAISLRLSVVDGAVYNWIGVEPNHSSEAIDALGRYAWSLMPTRRPVTQPWWRLLGAAIINLFKGEHA